MDPSRALPPDFFSEIAKGGCIDAAILFKRNGRTLAAWARNRVAWDVVTVMAATTLGSLETLLETLGSASPRTLSIVASGHRIYVVKVEPQGALALVAEEAVPEAYLRDAARQILAKLGPAADGTSPRRVTLGPNSH